jgi:hypothetical protein
MVRRSFIGRCCARRVSLLANWMGVTFSMNLAPTKMSEHDDPKTSADCGFRSLHSFLPCQLSMHCMLKDRSVVAAITFLHKPKNIHSTLAITNDQFIMSGMADEEQAAAGIMNDGVSKTDNTQTQPGMVVVSGDEYVQHDAPKRRSHVCWYVQQMNGRGRGVFYH